MMEDVDAKLVNVAEWPSDGTIIHEAGWLELATRAVELLGVALGRMSHRTSDSRRIPRSTMIQHVVAMNLDRRSV
jgi:hypothetical protein